MEYLTLKVLFFDMIFVLDSMDQIVNVNEFQGLAKRALPKMYYDFYRGWTHSQGKRGSFH